MQSAQQLSLLQAEQAQLPQSFFVGKMFPPSDHSLCPSSRFIPPESRSSCRATVVKGIYYGFMKHQRMLISILNKMTFSSSPISIVHLSLSSTGARFAFTAVINTQRLGQTYCHQHTVDDCSVKQKDLFPILVSFHKAERVENLMFVN